MLKRQDKSGPRDPYFSSIQSALKAADITQPTLVLDRDRLERNISRLRHDLAPDMALRLVAKSLPSIPLLKAVSQGTATSRFMTFNAPMLNELANAFPDADQLLGKPFPVKAAAQFYSNNQGAASGARIGWLIDTPQRLREYADLAQARSLTLAVSLEIDVGLHRGGFVPGEALADALALIHGHPHLTLHGFLGYEVHVAKLPDTFGLRDKALRKAWGIHAAALNQARVVFGADYVSTMIRNAGGSPTFRLYTDTTIANEVSVGSALLRPTDFDTDMLQDYAPALFIATPALKVLGPMQTPVLERFDRLKNLLNPNLATRIFIHGGYWKAKPVDPPGLGLNPTYGRSSNQELLTGGARVDLQPDDFVFLRPTQSEAMLLHFGDIAVYANGVITDMWEPMNVSA
ncbi:alanine racemase [Sulfitobacter sp. F26169L]|uniref:alanine racemase n=1 Tax=Sulfitobacter sp. F26169L TaxID=2996015 RepID=UPI0022608B3B|nr:alanine racemase [Sulfitobacter sp. F26169L]MCX7568182.1 alanine racemase [Sulfitobacter sp. F26169L]